MDDAMETPADLLQEMINLFEATEGGFAALVHDEDNEWRVLYGEDGCEETRIYARIGDLVTGETARILAKMMDKRE